MKNTVQMSQKQILAKINKFEKRNPGHHEIPLVLFKRMKGVRNQGVETWATNPLIKIIKPMYDQKECWRNAYMCTPCKTEYAQDFHYDSTLHMLRILWLEIDAHWSGDTNRDWSQKDAFYVDIDTCNVFNKNGNMMSRTKEWFPVYNRNGLVSHRRWRSAYSYRHPSFAIMNEILRAMINDNPDLQRNISSWAASHQTEGHVTAWQIFEILRKKPVEPKTHETARDKEIAYFKKICDENPRLAGTSSDTSCYTVEKYGTYKKYALYLIRIYSKVSCGYARETERIFFTRKMSTKFEYENDCWQYDQWYFAPYYCKAKEPISGANSGVFNIAKLADRQIYPDDVIRIFRNKFSEQLMAIECYSLALAVARNMNNNSYSHFHADADSVPGKTVFQWLRITPAQAKLMECSEVCKDTYNVSFAIARLKDFLGDNLSSFGNIVGDILPYAANQPYTHRDLFKRIVYKTIKCAQKAEPIIVRDTVKIMSQVQTDENGVHIDWDSVVHNIRSTDDIVRLHDRLIRLREVQRQRERELASVEMAEAEAAYKKNLKKIKENYEYADDNFLILVPNNGSEIRIEGGILHHCVGGYADRHIKRLTTILFLRKKESPDRSFYTIEVCDRTVVQVHGVCNKWIGNDPDAARFAYHWAKDKKIYVDKTILLNCGSGYGSQGPYLPESELY